MITFHKFIAQRGHEKPFGGYRSLFGFIWWFWIPRLHAQPPDSQNPRVIRVIWLCFAVGLSVWGQESKAVWPSKQNIKPRRQTNE
jgi:hypothetical protein